MEATLAASWGERIARQREALHYTQAQLAELVGLTERQIRRYEQGGKIPPDVVKLRLAGALRKKVVDLFPFPAVVPPNPTREAVAS